MFQRRFLSTPLTQDTFGTVEDPALTARTCGGFGFNARYSGK